MATTYDASRQASRSRLSWSNPFRGRSGALDEARRAAIHEAHNRQETPGFAKSIERRLKGQVILLVDARIQQI